MSEIFSGLASEELWMRINSIGKKKKRKKLAKAVENVLYLLCCRLQELETKLEKK